MRSSLELSFPPVLRASACVLSSTSTPFPLLLREKCSPPLSGTPVFLKPEAQSPDVVGPLPLFRTSERHLSARRLPTIFPSLVGFAYCCAIPPFSPCKSRVTSFTNGQPAPRSFPLLRCSPRRSQKKKSALFFPPFSDTQSSNLRSKPSPLSRSTAGSRGTTRPVNSRGARPSAPPYLFRRPLSAW